MYCILYNRCKYEYKCCNDCKQKCDERCTDEQTSCRFCTKIEPCFVQKFIIDNKEIVISKQKQQKIAEKVAQEVVKTTTKNESKNVLVKLPSLPTTKNKVVLKKKKSLI